MPSSCVSARRAKKNREKKRAKPNQPESQPEAKPNQPGAKPNQPESQPQPNQTSQKASQPNQPESQPGAKPNQPESQPGAKPNQPEANQKSQPGFPSRALALQKQRQLLGILPNRISRGHYFTPARSVLDFESFAGRGQTLDGQVLGASQVEYKPFGKPPLKREVLCSVFALSRGAVCSRCSRCAVRAVRV